MFTKLKQMALVVGLLAVSLMGTACSERINPGYVGIVVNSSGAQRGVADYPATTGRVWYNPITTDVFEYPTFVQNVVWEGNDAFSFTNKDKFPISVDVNISYSLIADKVPSFYVKFRNDDLYAFSHGFLHSAAREAITEAGGLYNIDEVMGDNSKFVADVRARLEKRLEPLGVKIDQFGLVRAPRPPAVVVEAIAASAQATQKAIQIQNELAQTEAEAKKQIARATGAATARIAAAEADAKANRLISESITPTLVQYMQAQAAQKWDGKLPSTVAGGGGVVPFVNIGAAK
jgi:regulator of protease activity HflC (stomatin/prohibitin superfamily)